MLKFVNGGIVEVPDGDARLGIVFMMNADGADERQARDRCYGPVGTPLRDRDTEFRKRHEIK